MITPAADGLAEALQGLARAGDSAAWERIVVSQGEAIRRLALRVLREPMLADDAAQEALLAIRAHAHAFRLRGEDPDLEARRWIARVAINAALRLRRSERRLGERERRARAELPAAVERDQDAGGDEALAAAVDELPDDQRLPLLLHHVDELDYQEIAEALGIRAGAARVRVHRAIAFLRRRLRSPASAVLAMLGAASSEPTGVDAETRAQWRSLRESPRATVVTLADLEASHRWPLPLGSVALRSAAAVAVAAIVAASATSRWRSSGEATRRDERSAAAEASAAAADLVRARGFLSRVAAAPTADDDGFHVAWTQDVVGETAMSGGQLSFTATNRAGVDKVVSVHIHQTIHPWPGQEVFRWIGPLFCVPVRVATTRALPEVSLDADEQPLRVVLDRICAQTGTDWGLEPVTAGSPTGVGVVIVDRPLQAAQ